MSASSEQVDLWTIRRVLGWTSTRFDEAGLASPRLDAELLLAWVQGVERLQLYLEHDKPLNKEELVRYRRVIQRRLAGEPVAYIVGQREFWSLSLEVSPAVLVPRPETELLVELAAAKGRDLPRPQVVDVGTGSGAIALALAQELPQAQLYATDSSAAALSLARRNAAAQGTELQLFEGDLLTPLPAELQPDLIVSNPPYIPSAQIETLQLEVRDWEPRAALDGGPDGLAVIRRLLDQAAERLRPGGWLILEIGHDQGAALQQELAQRRFGAVAVHQDLAGLDRAALGRRAPA